MPRTALSKLNDICPKLMNQPFSVQGSLASLDEYMLDRYFSSDGKYMAEYQTGHTIKQTTPCSVTVMPFKKIKIYHISSRQFFEYDSSMKVPVWRQRRMVTASVANSTIGMLGSAAAARGSAFNPTGKGNFAGYTCDFYEVVAPSGGGISVCQWSPPSQITAAPTAISLHDETKDASGNVLNTLTAQEVELGVRIPAHIFQPSGAQ